MANAMESGSATTATTTPETMSFGIWRRNSSLLECLMMLNNIGLILSRCMAFVSRLDCRFQSSCNATRRVVETTKPQPGRFPGWSVMCLQIVRHA